MASVGAGSGLPLRDRRGHAKADFRWSSEGSEYLDLVQGEALSLEVKGSDVDSGAVEGWAFGRRCRDGASGWFPSAYFEPLAAAEASPTAAAAPPPPPPPAAAAAAAAAVAAPEWSPDAASALERAAAAAAAAAASSAVSSRSCNAEPHGPPPPQPEPQPAAGTFPDDAAEPGPGCGFDPGGVSDGPDYSRDELLFQGAPWLERARADAGGAGIALHPRPPQHDYLEPPEPLPLDNSVKALAAVAGGKARVGNIAAAGLALGVMSGSHHKVCREILEMVQTKADAFYPIPVCMASEVHKMFVMVRD